MNNPTDEIRQVLQRFQDGYITRDVKNLDAFMELFVPGDEAELIGIGAAVRNQNEWFQGAARIREIVESDWTYWGDVRLDVGGAKVTVNGETGWLSTTGAILQTDHIRTDEVMGFHIKQMKEFLENESLSPKERLDEATHFGVRRWREREKAAGYSWPFTFTAVLVKRDGKWMFHTIHWSMPVD
jgi:hypothetical protein